MKKLYCFICAKYKKLEGPEIKCLLERTFLLSIICSKCNNKVEKNI